MAALDVSRAHTVRCSFDASLRRFRTRWAASTWQSTAAPTDAGPLPRASSSRVTPLRELKRSRPIHQLRAGFPSRPERWPTLLPVPRWQVDLPSWRHSENAYSY